MFIKVKNQVFELSTVLCSSTSTQILLNEIGLNLEFYILKNVKIVKHILLPERMLFCQG